ncbi:MAG: GlsB/YeaQ/YmgE family stress response membrane protein [Planctomycetaceae bacterium]
MFPILGWIVFGLIAGWIARLLVPGRDPLGCLGTMLLGIAGSFVGGFIHHLLFRGDWGRFEPSSLIGSVLGAILLLLLGRWIGGRRRL